MKKIMLCLIFVLAMILSAQTAKAKSFSPVISYQGIIRDDNGSPVKDGKYPIVFKIYEDEKSIQEIWLEKQEINLAGGIINANIGSVSAFNLPFDKQYWLGLNINGEDYGRYPLSASAYSLHAKTLAEGAIIGKNGIRVEKNKTGQLEISGQTQSGNGTKGLGWQPNYNDPNAQYTEPNYNCGIGASTPNEKLTVDGVTSLKEQSTSPIMTDDYGKVYTKIDKNLYYKGSDGVESKLNNQTMPEKVYAEYTIDLEDLPLQSFTSDVYTTINYNKKVFDDNNVITTGNDWKFIAPKSGVYLFEGSIQIKTPTPVTQTSIYCVINGNRANTVAYTIMPSTLTGILNRYEKFTTMLKLNKYDAVTFKFLQASPSPTFTPRQLYNSELYNYIKVTEL